MIFTVLVASVQPIGNTQAKTPTGLLEPGSVRKPNLPDLGMIRLLFIIVNPKNK